MDNALAILDYLPLSYQEGIRIPCLMATSYVAAQHADIGKQPCKIYASGLSSTRS